MSMQAVLCGYFTPALTHELLSCCVNYTETAIKVANPDEVAGIKDLITKARRIPPGFQATGEDDEGKAERAIKPLSIALGVFGGIAALAALLIAMQVIGRHLRRRRQESEVLRALGADRTTLASDALIGVVGAVAVGSLLAVGVAVALSPLSPLARFGPFTRPRESLSTGPFSAVGSGSSSSALFLAPSGSPYPTPPLLQPVEGGWQPRVDAASQRPNARSASSGRHRPPLCPPARN